MLLIPSFVYMHYFNSAAMKSHLYSTFIYLFIYISMNSWIVMHYSMGCNPLLPLFIFIFRLCQSSTVGVLSVFWTCPLHFLSTFWNKMFKLTLDFTCPVISHLSKGSWMVLWRNIWASSSGHEGYWGVIIFLGPQWREPGSVSNFRTHWHFQFQSYSIPGFPLFYVWKKKRKPISSIVRHPAPIFLNVFILCSVLKYTVIFKMFMYTTARNKTINQSSMFVHAPFEFSLRVCSQNPIFKSYLEEFSTQPLFSVVMYSFEIHFDSLISLRGFLHILVECLCVCVLFF